MTVRKDEPMDNLAAMDDEFAALLEASSLGAPHVVAETSNIPATARSRMARAVRRRQKELSDSAAPEESQETEQADTTAAGGGPHSTEQQASEEEPRRIACPGASQESPGLGLMVLPTETGKAIQAAFTAVMHRAYRHEHTDALLPRWPWLDAGPQNWRTHLATLMDQSLQRSMRISRADDATWTVGSFHIRLVGGCRLALTDQDGANANDHKRQTALSACTGPGSLYELVTSAQIGSKPHAQSVHDLSRFIRPATAPITASAASAAPTPLSACSILPTQLHVARFAESAYNTGSGGLLLPTLARTQHSSSSGPRQMASLAVQHQTSEASRTLLWSATADGVRMQHAELPMLIHHDVHKTLTESLRTRLTYRVSDPYAVEARFRAGASDETVWTFARDLLREGLERGAGDGDVIVWPDTASGTEQRLFIRLASPEGTALLSAADTDVRVFVEAAGRLVGYGAERAHLEPALRALETTIGELTRPGSRD